MKEDISLKQKAQEEVFVKEGMAVLGHFTGSIAHEIHNPLAVIDRWIYLLKMKMGDADEIFGKYIDIIASNVRKAAAII